MNIACFVASECHFKLSYFDGIGSAIRDGFSVNDSQFNLDVDSTSITNVILFLADDMSYPLADVSITDVMRIYFFYNPDLHYPEYSVKKAGKK